MSPLADRSASKIHRIETYRLNREKLIALMENFSDKAMLRVHDRNGDLVFTVIPLFGSKPGDLFNQMRSQIRSEFHSMLVNKENQVNEMGTPTSVFLLKISKQDLDRVYVSVFDLFRFKRFWLLCIFVGAIVTFVQNVWSMNKVDN